MSKPLIKILISCHKDTAYIGNDILTPIFIGAAINKNNPLNMLRDDKGENISIKNPSYCELTAQYWAWKNLDADYYGFCHYRRYFSFAQKWHTQDVWGMINESNPTEQGLLQRYGWDEISIRNCLEETDIVTTLVQDIRKFPDSNKNLYRHYASASNLYIKDVDTLLEIIKDKYPDYHNDALNFFNGHQACFCNMFIMRKDIFFDYCKWLFDILAEFELRADMSHYNKQALRTPGHLAERLLNIYLLHIKNKNNQLKIKELQSVLFSDTDPLKRLMPAFDKACIPVFLASSDSFAPVAGVCLKSIIEHSSLESNYDIIILESGISSNNKKLMTDMLCGHTNFSLRFYNVRALLKGYRLKPSEHISIETYYRFLIQDLLPQAAKAIYIDSDLIVLTDLATLYNQDVSSSLLAAVPDADFQGQINSSEGTKKYALEELGLKDPYGYFQAGVLLLNLTEFRALHTVDEWLTLASEPHRYADQDVLNQCCQGRVQYLDMSWNVLMDCARKRISEVIEYAPVPLYQAYMQSRNNPKIVHFAGFKKPWQYPDEDFSEIFWEYARKTPFYEILIYNMTHAKPYKKRESPKLRALADKLFPKGSRRRAILKKLLFR